MSKSVLVATANLGEQNMPIDIVQKWEPDKITLIGDTIFFRVDDTFLSMKRIDFCNIFPEKCAHIKY